MQEITKILNIVNEERLMTVHIVANHLLANLQEGEIVWSVDCAQSKRKGKFPNKELNENLQKFKFKYQLIFDPPSFCPFYISSSMPVCILGIKLHENNKIYLNYKILNHLNFKKLET